VPGLSLTAEYRYEALSASRSYKATGTTPGVAGFASNVTRVHAGDDNNQSIMLGLRYEFDHTDQSGPVERPPPAPQHAAAPPAAPLPTPSDAPAPARTYLVFFDWNSAVLSPRAHEIIAEAVRNSSRLSFTRIEVTGNADRSGSGRANQAISLLRAQVVASELERNGVPSTEIDIHALGDTQPAVPTAAGARERADRRVEIVYI
jgi:outer membrane protein OmpA-like peptidoglycan-associated protein